MKARFIKRTALLLILSILFSLMVQPALAASNKEDMPNGVWTCICGNVNTADSNFCIKCGEAKPEMWICACGASNESEAAFCKNCGQRKSLSPYSAVGTIVPFGSYEQDGDAYNGKEQIEWIVLANDGKKALLISRYILNAKPYDNSEFKNWETSYIRAWLHAFYYGAFSTDEKVRIIENTLPVYSTSNQETASDSNLKDYAFILSPSEAKEYFSSNSSRACSATYYATNAGATDNRWWLLYDGNTYPNVLCVNGDGSVDKLGYRYDTESIGIRPAIWVSFDFQGSTESFFTDTEVIRIGGESFTLAEMNYTYASQYLSFRKAYGEYLSIFFDFDDSYGISSMEGHRCVLDESLDWREYFINVAIESLRLNQALISYANENNISLSDEDIMVLEMRYAELEEAAASFGYHNPDDMISDNYGPYANIELAKRMDRINLLAAKAYQAKSDEISSAILKENVGLTENDEDYATLLNSRLTEWSEALVSSEKVKKTDNIDLVGKFFPIA